MNDEPIGSVKDNIVTVAGEEVLESVAASHYFRPTAENIPKRQDYIVSEHVEIMVAINQSGEPLAVLFQRTD
jgi:hypothetical protein